MQINSTDKVLVTGAGGFIGSNLAKALVHAGADVCALVHYNSRNDWGNLEHLDKETLRSIKVISGDIRDASAIRSAMRGRGIVFHLAALIGIPYSYTNPGSYMATNAEGTLNVLQAALDLGVDRVVHTSTSEVYGTAKYVPMDEQHPLQAQSPYSASKIAADKIAESFFYTFGLPVVTLRPFNTYGPGQSARAIIPTIATQAIASRTVRLGSLSPVRDLIFVSDTVQGFLKAAKADHVTGQVINLGSGHGVTIEALANKIFDLLGVVREIECEPSRVRPEASEVMKLIASASKAEQLLGWTPQVSLEEGLSRTLEWVRAHLDGYKAEIYNV